MTAQPGAAVAAGTELLERALAHTRGSLALVTPAHLGRPTPCEQWSLADLLSHMDDSLMALHDAAATAVVDLAPARSQPGDGELPAVASLRSRGCDLLGAWSRLAADQSVSVGGRPLPASVVAVAGALEVAVHGWDVARACGDPRPLPDALAALLLRHAPALITPHDRGRRFAEPVAVAPPCSPSDRLLAYTGRASDWGP